MKKYLYSFSLLLIASLFFTSCGGSDYTETETSTAISSVSSGTEACVQNFYNTTVVNEIGQCGGCHYDNGAAKDTLLLMPNPSDYSESSNYAALKDYVYAHPQLVINKVDGFLTHMGGASFPISTLESIQSFVDYVGNVASCVVDNPVPEVSPISLASVTKASTSEIANMAAQVMLGRPATSTELANSSTESGLDTVLDAYMTDPVFYDWIKFSFNEFLFTDKYLENNDSLEILRDAGFANAGSWYAGDSNVAEVERRTNYGVNKAALELIANVIKEPGSNFGNILTANYRMVNAYSANSYPGVTVTNQYTVNGALVDETVFSKASIAGIPHAGILTDPVFLNRVPTTNTNHNRERASKIMLWFLDTDILELANRAVSASDQGAVYTYPTMENPSCTVCHKVMDPVAGLYKNWDDIGRYQNVGSRPQFDQWPVKTTSGPIGMDLNNLIPADQNNTSLQWLASEFVKDDRFRKASIKIFYKALTSRKALQQPATDDVNYYDKEQAFMFQEYIFNQINQKFQASNLNAKELIKDIIKSEVFSAIDSQDGTRNKYFGESIGLAQMITPELLDFKIKQLIGYSWTDRFDSTSVSNENGRHFLLDISNYYKALYGGIDSDTITVRPDGFNGIMASVQTRMANEMGCYSAPREFFLPNASRKLLKDVTVNMFPDSSNQADLDQIVTTISNLHNLLLGEATDKNSPEVMTTFELMRSVYLKGKENMLNNGESTNIPSMCRVTVDPDSTADLPGTDIISDPNYIIRSWAAVITYLLSDYKFIYNSNTK